MIDEAFRAAWSPRLLSILRLIAGLMFMQHGLSKYFGFPAPSPATFQMYGLLGAAGAIEIVGGALIAIGLFTRPAALLASGTMAVAYFQFHWKLAMDGWKFLPGVNGGEPAVLYCFVFLVFALSGAGALSVDAARGRS